MEESLNLPCPGKQQLSVQNITNMVQNQVGEALLQVWMSHFLLGLTFVTSMHAELMMEGIMGILKNPPTA